MFEVEKNGGNADNSMYICTLRHGSDSDEFVEGSVGFNHDCVPVCLHTRVI